ncbi:zinc-finger domain-containing protein [Methylophilaceae bacterium]|jgi:uncharacterized Zn-finger protein|nr:zinc-finger domain-containing protein [Methylophilaceae bacterium]NCV28227.1 zinc-finger domain-containing protein [Nitrosomonadales bacterium]NCV38499.1 zinc-finger domain-containing protein [Betaproteobacteria bacterium]MDA9913318.1 zinc-finger domain-containing protein [Methylophilaceae bacterium]MDC0626422.1 zinc-finger domain-containing protein [Methylophilaceae bacterium]
MSKNQQKVFEVDKKDLPVFCPPKNPNFWALHPRVYLDHHGKDTVNCPYCGTMYKII